MGVVWGVPGWGGGGGWAHSPQGRVRRAEALWERGRGAWPVAAGTGPGVRARAGRGPAPAGRAGTAGARPWGPAAHRVGARPRSRCWAPRRLPPWAPAGPRPQPRPGQGTQPWPQPGPGRWLGGPLGPGSCPHPWPLPRWALRPHPGAAGGAGAAGAQGSGGPQRLRGRCPPLNPLLERNARCYEPQAPLSQVGLPLSLPQVPAPPGRMFQGRCQSPPCPDRTQASRSWELEESAQSISVGQENRGAEGKRLAGSHAASAPPGWAAILRPCPAAGRLDPGRLRPGQPLRTGLR